MFNPLECELYEVDTLTVDSWAVTFGTARSLAVPNVTAHPSTASACTNHPIAV